MLLDDFKNITNYDIELFLNDYISFMDNEYVNLYSYYKGELKTLDSQSFEKFDKLKKENSTILSLFSLYKDSLKDNQYWELLSQIEEIAENFSTIDNLSKWLRSSVDLSSFDNSIKISHNLKQNQSIEDLIKNIDDSEENFNKVSRDNNAIEENISDGSLLKISLNNSAVFGIDSVIDNITDEKFYGIDIDQNIELKGEDLLQLTAKETASQIVDILLNLKKNDNPDISNEGILSSLLVGNNVNSVTYPILFRELYSVFLNEDSVKSISLIDIIKDQDQLFLNISVESKLGEIMKKSLSL